MVSCLLTLSEALAKGRSSVSQSRLPQFPRSLQSLRSAAISVHLQHWAWCLGGRWAFANGAHVRRRRAGRAGRAGRAVFLVGVQTIGARVSSVGPPIPLLQP